MDETRKRRDARLCCALTVCEAQNPAARLGVTKDLSLSGLFLVTKQRWGDGEAVALQLAHRHWNAQVNARVVRSQPDGVAFQLVDVDAETRQALGAMIDDLLADGAWFDSRRTNLRRGVQGPVTWSRSGMEVQSHLRDLSDGGAFIESDQPPTPGASVMVYLPQLGDDGSSTAVCGCQATVVHRSEQGFGVAFVFPTDAFQQAIASVLRATR